MKEIPYHRIDLPTGAGYMPQIIWHLVRYNFVTGFLKPTDTVLDGACGTGYGTRFLSDYCQDILGIDIDQGAINRARQLYDGENRRFAVESVLEVRDKYDIIVCYETLEHVSRDDGMKLLTNYKNCLNPGGVMFVSTPKKLPEEELSPNRIESHVYEYEYDEFSRLLNSLFLRPVIFSQTDAGIIIGNKKAVWTYIGVCYNG